MPSSGGADCNGGGGGGVDQEDPANVLGNSAVARSQTNNEFCWCSDLATGARVLAIISIVIRCILLTMYCLSDETQSGFNYWVEEWRGNFTSLDLGVCVLFLLAVMADLSLAKWAKSQSKFSTLVAVLCWLLVNVIAVIFQCVMLFSLLFGGSYKTGWNSDEYQVMLAVLAIALAYNIYCGLVFAHWRKNICEDLHHVNRPFQALSWLTNSTDHHRRDGESSFTDDGVPAASAPPPPPSPPPTYDEATKMAAASRASTAGTANAGAVPEEAVKINIYSDDPEAKGAEPPDYNDVIKGRNNSSSSSS